MESKWLSKAKRLQAIAETGMVYTSDKYELERYEEVSRIALSILSDLGYEPIERVKDLVSEGAKGYITPKVDVRGAVFSGTKILLVKEKADGLWTLPGGFADVGLSPAENIEKEIAEEAGILTTASSLYAVKHKAKGEYDPDVRDFYKLFFLCESEYHSEPVPGIETSGADYFELSDLPPLSKGRTVESDLHSAWKFHCNRGREAYFE